MRLGKKMADIINPLIVENNGDLIHITSAGERKGIPDPSRLLPENPGDGDVPVFNATATTGGGNNETVKLLIQPSTSENQIVDSANGNAAPVSISHGNSGSLVTVDEAGNLSFPGSGSYITAALAAMSSVITGTSEFCIDITISPKWESGTRKFFHIGADGWYAYLNPGNGTFWFWGKGHDNLSMGLNYGETHRLTIEQWNSDGTWKLSVYTDGAVKYTFDMQVGAMSTDMRFGIGDNDEGGGFLGTMNNIRVRNIAPYRGVSFSPDATPYTVPQVVGDWKATPAKELVSDAIDASRLLPDPQSISSEKSGLPLVFKSDYKADSSFILCFPFDGDIVDYSTNRVQVTNDYVTLASDVPEGSGQSAYFNASACLRGTLPVVLGTSDLTINAWIKLQHTGSNQTFFSTRDGNASSSEAFSFDVHDDGELFMYSTSEHTSRISSAEKMTFGEWHHVRMIRSLNTVKLYLDGKLHAEGTCSNNWTWTAFAIGMLYRKNDSYNQLKGYMSAFQLLNYAMPFEEFTPVFDYGININKRFEVAEDNLCDDAISAHNTSLDAHPMQGATTNDYNGLDTNCSWYLSYGNNTSNVNAPANGPFFVMTKRWTNSSGSAGAAMQVAVRNMTGSLTTQEMYIRTASLSGGSLRWRTWQKVGSSAMAGSPNYGAGVDITSTLRQGVYAAPSVGWIYAKAKGVSISGNLIGDVTQIVLPVAAGDTITADAVTTAKFYPNR